MKSTPFSDHLLGVVVVEKDKKKRGINEKTVCFEVEWLEVFQYEKQNIHPRISPQLGIEILCKYIYIYIYLCLVRTDTSRRAGAILEYHSAQHTKHAEQPSPWPCNILHT